MTTLRTHRRRHKEQIRTAPPRASLQPYVWMLCSSIAFASMVEFAQGLKGRCDWQVIAFTRSSIAMLIAAVLVVLSGKRFAIFKPPILWMRSLAGSVSLVCTFYALSSGLHAADVLTLTNMVPIWVAVLSWPLFGRFPSPTIWICAAISVFGVAVMHEATFDNNDSFAMILAFISSFTSAIAMLGLNRLYYLDHRAIVFHFSALGTLVCLVCFFVFGRKHALAEMANVPTLLCLVGVGVSATVGQLFLTRAYAAGAPAKVAVVGLTQVVFAMVLDVLLFDRGLDPVTLIGMALIIGPTAWVLLQRRATADSL